MKPIAFAFFCIFCALSACRKYDNCRDIGCLSPVAEDFFTLRLLSATDTTDLLFGPDPRYNPDSLRLFSIASTTDTVEHEIDKTPYYSAPPDSVLHATIYRLHQTAFLRLSDDDVDTLTLAYERIDDGGCCGPYTRLVSLAYNGGIAMPSTSDVIILYK